MNKPNSEYHFFVGTTRYESDESQLQGSRIKEMAAAQSGDGLLLEGHGNDPDEVIQDDQFVDLGHQHGGPRRFRVEPAATFGG